MTKTAAKRSSRRQASEFRPGVRGEVLRAVKAQGFASLHDACLQTKSSYVKVQGILRRGLQKRTTHETVEDLKRLGIFDVIKKSA